MLPAPALDAPYTLVASRTVTERVERLLRAVPGNGASIVLSAQRLAGTRLMDLKGLGKEIWQGEDAQAYVDRLRDMWQG